MVNTESIQPSQASTKKCGVMLVLKGGDVLFDPLYCCTAVHYLTVFSLANCDLYTRTKSSDIRKKVASLNSCITSLYVASARSGRVVPENSRSQVIRSGRFNWGGYHRLKSYDRLSKKYSSSI